MASAVLYRVIWPVFGIDRAAAFYGAVLEDPGERVSAGRHYFTCGATILALYDPVADGDGPGHGWRHHDKGYLYFAVSDLETARERVIAAGGLDVSEPETYSWGETRFTPPTHAATPLPSWTGRPSFAGALASADRSAAFGERAGDGPPRHVPNPHADAIFGGPAFLDSVSRPMVHSLGSFAPFEEVWPWPRRSLVCS